MSIKEAIYDLADEYGSSAPHTGTKLDALDALTDALAGSNKAKSKSVEEAVANLKSYLPETPTGTLSITENGEGINVTQYAAVDVAVPNPSTGTLSITENGEGIDVTQYAAVDVAVPGPSFGALGYVTSTDQTPTVGYPLNNPQEECISAALVGNDVVAEVVDMVPAFAAGLKLRTIEVSVDMCDVWVVTFGEGTDNIATAQKVAESYSEDPDVTRTAVNDKYTYTFTMPETTEGQFVVVYPWAS